MDFAFSNDISSSSSSSVSSDSPPLPSCTALASAMMRLIPGIARDYIRCSNSATDCSMNYSEDNASARVLCMGVDLFVNYDTPVAVMSYIVNATQSGSLATLLYNHSSTVNISLITPPSVQRKWPCPFPSTESPSSSSSSSSSLFSPFSVCVSDKSDLQCDSENNKGSDSYEGASVRNRVYVSDRTCCHHCESLIEFYYRLDFGVYLLQLRQYEWDRLQFQSGMVLCVWCCVVFGGCCMVVYLVLCCVWCMVGCLVLCIVVYVLFILFFLTIFLLVYLDLMDFDRTVGEWDDAMASYLSVEAAYHSHPSEIDRRRVVVCLCVLCVRVVCM